MLGVPHLYDMHSSLPQQLANFAFSRSRVLAAVFAWIERFVIRRSRVVIVICPQLEDVVRAVEPGGTDGADRERAGIGRCAVRGIRRAPCVRRSGSARRRRSSSTRGHSRRIRDWTCCLRRWRACSEREPDAGSCSPAAGPIRSRRRGARPRRAGIGGATIFAGQRPAEEIPAFLRRGRRPRVAAEPRHEHAAQDLPVPPLGTPDRGDAAADAHAGAERRGRVS